jgi:hypothetical protein
LEVLLTKRLRDVVVGVKWERCGRDERELRAERLEDGSTQEVEKKDGRTARTVERSRGRGRGRNGDTGAELLLPLGGPSLVEWGWTGSGEMG